MRDPWKYVAFPAAAVTGYLLSLVLTAQFQAVLGVSQFIARLLVIAATGLVAGFFVDEVLPAYVEKVRQRRGGAADIGGGTDDFDFD